MENTPRRPPIWMPVLALLVSIALAVACIYVVQMEPASMLALLGILAGCGVDYLLLYKWVKLRKAYDAAQMPNHVVSMENLEQTEPTFEPQELFLTAVWSGKVYQVVRGEEQYHLVYCGNIVKDDVQIDKSRCLYLQDTDDALLTQLAKKEIVIPKGQIQRIVITSRSKLVGDCCCAGLRIQKQNGRARYEVIGVYTPEQIRAFFPEMQNRIELDENKLERQEKQEARLRAENEWRRDHQNPKTFRVLKTLEIAMGVLGVILLFVWPLTDVLYRPLAYLLVLMTLSPQILVLLFPAYFSLLRENRRKGNDHRADVKVISPWLSALLSGLALVYAQWNVTLLDETEWILWAVGTDFVLTLLILLTVRECKMHPVMALFMVGVFSFVQSIAVVGELNILLDRGQPEVEWHEVIDKSIAHNFKGLTSYDLWLMTEAGRQSFNVYSDLYDETEIGDDVIVVVYPGAFGIRNADVWGVDEWEAVQAETN